MSYSSKLDIKPLSPKYVDYFSKCFTNRFNVLEGAFRSGKSVCNVLSFGLYLETCEDKLHLVSGATVASARLNVADNNGLGLKYLFRGRCKVGKYEENECLKINTKTGEKIVIFVGGAKSDSYKAIQGISYGSWLSVECANLYISNDEHCFIDMALSRLTQSKNQRIWWDLNPVHERHKLYVKYLDKFEQQQKEGTFFGGYNYMKCSLFDNAALTSEQRQNYLSYYPDKNSVEYRRYILGERCAASGLIFKDFALHKEKYIVNDLDEFLKGVKPQFGCIGIDFGGNGSNTAYTYTLFLNNYSSIIIIADDLLDMSDGNSTVADFDKKLEEFINRVNKIGVGKILYLFADNADTVMVNQCKQVIKRMGLYGQIKIMGSQKHTIKKRIDTKTLLMNRGKWFVYKDALNTIDSTSTQVYDDREGHEDERLDNGTVNIDSADSEEYSWSAFLGKLLYNIDK